MKHNTICWWFVCLAFLLVAAYLIAAIGIPMLEYRHSRAKIMSTDSTALLAACRELISHREKFANTASDFCSEYYSVGPAELGDSPHIPALIRELHPLGIDIGTNRVIVNLRGAPRVGFIGYSEDSIQTRISNEEIRTFLITNGLWRF